ncbi:hypothetical protein ACEK07_18610 [Alcanivoracaceae bacterium MT1]
MRFLLLLLILVSVNCAAREWKTDYFSIDLPESMDVEIDKEKRLLAFPKGDPYSMPFLFIEFGTEVSFKEVLRDLNEELKHYEGEMLPESCSPNCRVYYFEGESLGRGSKNGGETTYLYHYVLEISGRVFVISYVDDASLKDGGRFVRSIGKRIHAQVRPRA